MLVTVRPTDPVGIWVDDYPVVVPFFDAVYAPSTVAHDLAEEWATDLYWLKFSLDHEYMVYLPQDTRTTVEWTATTLNLI
jgi:hypothetical protein